MIAQESFDATSTTNGPGYTDPVTGATAYPLRREEPILSMALPLEAYTQTLTRNGNTNAGFSFTDAINYAGDTSRTILNAAVGFEQAALNTGLSLLQVGADSILQVGNILTGRMNGDDSIIQGALIRQGARGQGIADFLSDPFNNTVNGVVGIGERLGENAAIGGAAGGREFGKAAFDGVSLAFGVAALPKTAAGLYGEVGVLGGKTLSIVDEFFSTPSPSGYRAQLGALGDLTGYTAQVGGANTAANAAARTEAASNIWQARSILAETRPDLTIVERNQIIKAFDPQSFRVNTLTSPANEFRYFDGLPDGAGLNGRWSTSQWFETPADRISNLALPNNQATQAATVTLQPGTTVFQGTVSSQFGFGSNLTGGGLQTYNAMGPWALIKAIP